MGSDGLFEFLSNRRISEILTPYYKLNNPSFGCEILIEESIKLWKKVIIKNSIRMIQMLMISHVSSFFLINNISYINSSNLRIK